MDRRKVLLVVAVLVAALGATMVFLYVRSADDRAEQRFVLKDVLRATQVINPGETVEDAQAAGKFQLEPVPEDQLVAGNQADTTALAGKFALTTIYPGEQLLDTKFGDATAVPSTLQIPAGQVAISVNLTDTARVAGFVNPGSQVAIFVSGNLTALDASGEQQGPDTPITTLLMPRVTVLGVGSTTPVSTTTTDETGASTTEQLPRTLMTLALDQKDAERVIYASGNGELAFALLTEDSEVAASTPVTAADLLAATS